jgi:NADPH-dependent ferric siderophore reductase
MEEPMPSRSIEKTRYPLRIRKLEVRGVKRPRPRYILLTLGGDELSDFRTDNPTDHLKIVPPDPETGELLLPRVVDGQLVYDDDRRPGLRDYTVRRFDPEANELDVRILAHGAGLVSSWAERARPGDVVGAIGPRSTKAMPDGYANYVLIGDRTAIPSIARWLGALPEGATAQILIAARDEEDLIELRSEEPVFVRWYTEGGTGVDADQLPAAVKALELYSPDTWAWAAGEAVAMREVRRLLLAKPGLTKETVRVSGYWRRDRAGHDHHEPLETD